LLKKYIFVVVLKALKLNIKQLAKKRQWLNERNSWNIFSKMSAKLLQRWIKQPAYFNQVI
jgi:hypothetical protein